MQRHPADLVSLVFGILFLGTVGVATVIGELGWDRFTANAWLVDYNNRPNHGNWMNGRTPIDMTNRKQTA